MILMTAIDLKTAPVVGSGVTGDTILIGAANGQTDALPQPIALSAVRQFIVSSLPGGGDLPDTGVTPGSYGSATAVAKFTVDGKGRLTAAGEQAISVSLASVVGLESALTAMTSALGGKSDLGHTHDDRYFTKSEVTSQLAGKANTSHAHAIADVTNLQATLDGKAPLASPTFTGTPAAPTATAGTNTTQVATTAFVQAGLSTKANSSHTHAIANVTGLQAVLDNKPSYSEIRKRLTAERTYYLRADGNDGNDGLSDKPGGAWRTPQRAMTEIVSNVDLAGQNIAVQFGPGTYDALYAQTFTGGSYVFWVGNQSASSSVIVTQTNSLAGPVLDIEPEGVGIHIFQGIQFQNNSGSGAGERRVVYVGRRSRAEFVDCNYVTNTSDPRVFFVDDQAYASIDGTTVITVNGGADFALHAARGGMLSVAGDITINGLNGCLGFMYAQQRGHIEFHPSTVTINGSPNIGFDFALAEYLSLIESDGVSFTGAVTGGRAHASGGSLIETYGEPDTYFPGDIGPTVESGGIYRYNNGDLIAGYSSLSSLGAGTLTPGLPFGGRVVHIKDTGSENAGLFLDAGPSGYAIVALGQDGASYWHFQAAPGGDWEVVESGVATRFAVEKGTGNVYINGTRVLSPRKTGWNAPTGTLTRGTFNSGATLAVTAQTLAALITDLRAHGLIES